MLSDKREMFSVQQLQKIGEDVHAMGLTGFTYWFEFRERLNAAAQPAESGVGKGIQPDGSWICPTCHDPKCGMEDAPPAAQRSEGRSVSRGRGASAV